MNSNSIVRMASQGTLRLFSFGSASRRRRRDLRAHVMINHEPGFWRVPYLGWVASPAVPSPDEAVPSEKN
jgi:hypothetical protein